MCTPVKDDMQIYTLILFSSIGYNTPGIQAKRLDHVLTTTYNNRPHLTTFLGDCFDGFNRRYNQLVFNSLIATNELTIIPTYHQSSSSRIGVQPRTEDESICSYHDSSPSAIQQTVYCSASKCSLI